MNVYGVMVGLVLTGERSIGGIGTDGGKKYWWDWY
jgi:hypothetical protein